MIIEHTQAADETGRLMIVYFYPTLKACTIKAPNHESQISDLIISGLCNDISIGRTSQKGSIELLNWEEGSQTILVFFCKPNEDVYYTKGLIHHEYLLNYTKDTVEGWVIDKSDESGEHVQEVVKTDAREYLKDNMSEMIKQYIENGKLYYKL